MNRLEILAEIDKLEDNHCATCKLVDSQDSNQYCVTKCNVGKKLTKLGEKLLKPSNDKVKKLLAKGKDLTYSEIQYLLEKEVTKTKIAKSLGMKIVELNIYLKQISEGMNMRDNVQRVKELTEKGMKPKEIAKELGVTVNTVYKYRHEAKGTKSDKKQDKKKNESLERENKSLAEQIKKLADENIKLEKESKKYKGFYKELDDDYTELQDKYLKSKSIEKELEKLRKENSNLRLLIAVKEDEVKELDKHLEAETIKHETLFKYVTLSKEGAGCTGH